MNNEDNFDYQINIYNSINKIVQKGYKKSFNNGLKTAIAIINDFELTDTMEKNILIQEIKKKLNKKI